MRALRLRWAWPLLVLTAAGCGHAKQARPATAFAPQPEGVEAALPVVPRLPMERCLTSPDLPGDPALTTTPYRGLTEHLCQCLAARNSSLGNLLERQRQMQAGANPHRGKRLNQLRDEVLADSAVEARNLSAGSALEMYYRLAEAEARSELLQESLRLTEEVLTYYDGLSERGLKRPPEADALRRQHLDLQADRERLRLAVGQLNQELKRLLGLPDGPDEWRLYPVGLPPVVDRPLDAEAAVAFGLAHRHELAVWRRLSRDLDLATLPAAHKALESISPLLGKDELPALFPLAHKLTELFLGGGARQAELSTRRNQMGQAYGDREQTVAADIRQGVQTLPARAQLVALARRRADLWARKVAEVEDKMKQGLASFPEVAAARLEWLKARDELVREVAAWHLARVKLNQALGLLAEECGYPPPRGAADGDCPTPAAGAGGEASAGGWRRPCTVDP